MQEVRLIDANAAADEIMRGVETHADEIGIGAVAILIAFARALRDETDFPTIDAEPVRHGRWETINQLYANVYCSECGAAADKYLAKRYKGCPFCLCVMDATDTNVGGKGGTDNDA